MRRKQRKGLPPVRRRAAHARGARRRDLLRLHEGDPVQAPLHGPGRLPVGQQHPQRLAGAHRRRQRRQGHRRSSHVEDGKQAAHRDDADRQEGPADPQRRDDRRSARASSSRATSSSTSAPARRRRPRCGDGDRVPINQTSAPVQLDQVLSALQAPTREDLQALLRELSSGLKGTGGARLQRVDPVLEARLPRRRDRRRRAAGHAAGRPRGATSTRPASPPRRSTATASSSSRWSPTSTRRPAPSPRASRSSRPPSASCRARCAPRMPALGALNRSFPAVRAPDPRRRARRVRSSGPAIDASMPFVTQARGLVSKPELRGLVADLRPLVPALTTLNQRSVPLYEQVSPASSCQNDVILPWTKDKIDGQEVPGRTARSTRRRPSRCPASPARAARATPTASGSACMRRPTPKFAYPMGDRQVLPHRRSRSRASTRRRPRTTRARRCAPTCRARRSRRRTCAPCPTRRRRASTWPEPSAAARARRRCRRPSTGCARTSRPRARIAQGLRRAGHREGADEVKTRDPQARRATSSRSSGSLVVAGARGRLHPRTTSGCASRWEDKPFELKAAFSDRPGRHAGPGPDRARLGRARRRHRARSSSRTATPS